MVQKAPYIIYVFKFTLQLILAHHNLQQGLKVHLVKLKFNWTLTIRSLIFHSPKYACHRNLQIFHLPFKSVEINKTVYKAPLILEDTVIICINQENFRV